MWVILILLGKCKVMYIERMKIVLPVGRYVFSYTHIYVSIFRLVWGKYKVVRNNNNYFY